MSNILIITEFVAPIQAIASIRWTKLGKYLAKNHGHHIYILTNTKDFDGELLDERQYNKDETLVADLDFFSGYLQFDSPIETRRAIRLFNLGRKVNGQGVASSSKPVDGDAPSVGFPAALSSVKNRIGAIARKVVGAGKRWALLRREGLCAEHFPKAASERYREAVAAGEIPSCDIVISTCGPSWPHAAATLIKRSGLARPWIADFRDAPKGCLEEPERRIRRFYKEYESADSISLVSRAIEDDLWIRHGQDVFELANGFDPDDTQGKSRSKQSKYRIVYTGVLYSHGVMKRDLSPIFEAIEYLQAEGRVDIDDVEICYAGSTPDLFQKQIDQYPNLVPRTRNLGLLPRSEALDLQRSASVLAIATWNTADYQGVTTGKIWEYLLSGAPIVGTCTGEIPNPYLGEVIRDSGAGVMIEVERLDETLPPAIDFLAGLYDEWKKSGTATVAIDGDFINQFSYPALANRLNEKIAGLLGADSELPA